MYWTKEEYIKRGINILTREYQPGDMETFEEYIKRLMVIRKRMVNYNPNHKNKITVGGQFNGFNVIIDNTTTIELIREAWSNYWNKIKCQ